MNDTAPSRTATNGELINRVQQLRLKDQLGAGKGSGRGGASWLPWILCLMLAVAWAAVGVRGYKGGFGNAKNNATNTEPASGNSPSKSFAPASNTGTVAEAGAIVLEQKGTLIPPQQIAISPIDVAGRVVELNIVEGKSFKKGEVLAKLEDVNYQAQVAESKANVAATKARFEATKLRLSELLPASVRKIEVTQVEEEYKENEALRGRQADELSRLERLGASAAERETKQARFDILATDAKLRRLAATLQILKEGPRQERKAAAEADVAAASAEVDVAQARLLQSQWRLDNCIIRAPIDGVALTKKAELGNLVNPLAFGSTSGSICDLANLAEMEVEIDVAERDLRKVFDNQDAVVRSEAYPERSYKGYIARIMPIADDSKSVVKVRVKVMLQKNEVPGSFLKPKMGVVVTLYNRKYNANTPIEMPKAN